MLVQIYYFYNFQINYHSIYNMTGPVQITSQALPEKLKKIGTDRIIKLKEALSSLGCSRMMLDQFDSAIKWAESNNTWEQHRNLFWKETRRLDEIRNENFLETFPELSELLSL